MSLVWHLLVMAVMWTIGASQEMFDEGKVTVSLKQGNISAVRQEGAPGKFFYSFMGIPYAHPPVGDFRLRDPVPAGPWDGTRNGSVMPPVCPQLSSAEYLQNKILVRGQEDCLFLNVYTPRPYKSDLPVMVWLHGGAFLKGGAEEYSPLPLLSRNIVLVIIQYRLGILGFLSTEDLILPGNLGLKDQTLALRWVQENIRDLGGDPCKVTVFGEGAGAASAHLQTLTPKAAGLFNRAILQSGSSLSPWVLRNDHKKVAVTVGQVFNCSGVSLNGTYVDSTRLLFCLQDLPLEDLVALPSAFVVWMNAPAVMTPRVDRSYLPNHPARLLKHGFFNKIDIISGITKHEGALAAIPMLMNVDIQDDFLEQFNEVGPVMLNLDSEPNAQHLSTRAYQQYLGPAGFSTTSVEALPKLFGDAVFRVSHDETTQLHTRGLGSPGGSVFAYQLDHRGQNSLVDLYNSSFGSDWVGHGDDLQYLFSGVSPFPPLEQPADLRLRDLILDLWTNFASTGMPTPDESLGFRWLPVTPTCFKYLSLTPTPTMKTNVGQQVRDFWSRLPTKKNRILYPENFSFGWFPQSQGRLQKLANCPNLVTSVIRYIHPQPPHFIPHHHVRRWH